jgi:hypothetical protein
LVRAELEVEVEEVVADKGYHKAQTLAECVGWGQCCEQLSVME